MILGIDEVGRGPWAGPLVVGAVVLPDEHTIEGLTDSKKLSAKRRRELDAMIRQQALGFGLGWVHADELDNIGLSAALRLATKRAVEAITTPYHEIIIDGTINFLQDTNRGRFVTVLPKADLLIPAVSAASIIAKVARDQFMHEQDALYPGYGFASHVGYGTATHRKVLEAQGVTPLHRTSFAPIAKLLGNATATLPGKTKQASSGALAETVVAEWLTKQGLTIVERNWKTKWCEIDIIAESDDTRYFVEVKYRRSPHHGDGFEAVTPRKQRQLRFAAELYSTQHATAKDEQLVAAAVTDTDTVDLVKIE
jgi:ribonuclease HII